MKALSFLPPAIVVGAFSLLAVLTFLGYQVHQESWYGVLSAVLVVIVSAFALGCFYYFWWQYAIWVEPPGCALTVGLLVTLCFFINRTVDGALQEFSSGYTEVIVWAMGAWLITWVSWMPVMLRNKPWDPPAWFRRMT